MLWNVCKNLSHFKRSSLKDKVPIVAAQLKYFPTLRGVGWQAGLSEPHRNGLTPRWWLCSAPVPLCPRSEPLSSCRPPECCAWQTLPRWCSYSLGWTHSAWIERAGCSSLRPSPQLTRLWRERARERGKRGKDETSEFVYCTCDGRGRGWAICINRSNKCWYCIKQCL